ncbi:WxL domain-containing protein [Carnobacterium maltaromaticum]|uniref:lectin-like domain-containing protein n=1 Tax=Carnobacterium maltaromaticum TaxID=2751 RepID=UPI001E327A64|nr:WxL domain-containing protein [Carnobacterium maltaromaticum]
MIKRKVIPLLGIFILIFPIWMVPVKQYIQNQRVSATKEEQFIEEPSLLEPNNETLSDDIQGPLYYFQEQQMNAKINESFIIQIASDIQTDEVTISLPVEAQIEGNVIQDNKEDQWIIKRELDGNMFKVPVSFSQVGEYIVSIISDNGPTKNLVITIEEEFIPTEEYVEPKEEKGVESEAQLDSLIELEDDREPIEAEETSEINTTVTKDNFLQHFDLHGTARYDTESGLLVLTEALNNQSGNATLKEKLSINDTFTLKGQVNIGSKSNGADGMAFGFHDSDSTATGNTGNGMGLAGLKDAFGFKVDSNFNTTAGQGAARDPAALGGAPFAGFVYTENNGLLTTYMGNDAPAKRTGNMDGQFKDITLQYNPQENGNLLNVSYNGMEWSRDLSNWQSEINTALSFIISGSTGARNNIHEFKFESMDYVIGTGEIEVNYIDIDTGKKIVDTEIVEGPIRERLNVDLKADENDSPYLNGYDFVNIEAPEDFDFTDNSIEATSNRQTISVNFKRAQSHIDIKYINEQGNEIETPEVLTGKVGEMYDITPKEIPHYEFSHADGYLMLTGIHTRKREVFTLIYRNVQLSPLDPLDPEIEINPDNKPEIPVNQGLLSLEFVSNFQFDNQIISAQDKIYYAQSQRLLNDDGTVNKGEKRPNYVQITDRRLDNERSGWQLSVTQNAQFTAQSGQELVGARLRLKNQQLATTSQGGTPPSLQEKGPIELVPGSKRVLLVADGNEGKDTWIYRFGDAETAENSISLDVPKGANPEATNYSTTFTWELNAVPEN